MPIAELLERFLALLFPDRCAGCGAHGALLCAECSKHFVRYNDEPPRIADNLSAVQIAYVFQGPLRQALHQLKYRRKRRMARPLGILLAAHLQSHPLPIDAIAPIPLHPGRLAERGFNQAELLAREVAIACELPMIVGPLVRVKATNQQALLNTRGRIANVAEAFAWRGSLPPARIALVDDVLTTGATVNACAKALRAAGAHEVYALALARSTRASS